MSNTTITFLSYFKQKITDNKSIDPHNLKSQFNKLINNLIDICGMNDSINNTMITQLYIDIIDINKRYKELFDKLYKFSVKYVENKSGNTYTLIPLINEAIIQKQQSEMYEIIKYQVLFDFYKLYVYLIHKLNILESNDKITKQIIKEQILPNQLLNIDIKQSIFSRVFNEEKIFIEQIPESYTAIKKYLNNDVYDKTLHTLFEKIKSEKNIYVYTSENTQPPAALAQADAAALAQPPAAAQPPADAQTQADTAAALAQAQQAQAAQAAQTAQLIAQADAAALALAQSSLPPSPPPPQQPVPAPAPPHPAVKLPLPHPAPAVKLPLPHPAPPQKPPSRPLPTPPRQPASEVDDGAGVYAVSRYPYPIPQAIDHHVEQDVAAIKRNTEAQQSIAQQAAIEAEEAANAAKAAEIAVNTILNITDNNIVPTVLAIKDIAAAISQAEEAISQAYIAEIKAEEAETAAKTAKVIISNRTEPDIIKASNGAEEESNKAKVSYMFAVIYTAFTVQKTTISKLPAESDKIANAYQKLSAIQSTVLQETRHQSGLSEQGITFGDNLAIASRQDTKVALKELLQIAKDAVSELRIKIDEPPPPPPPRQRPRQRPLPFEPAAFEPAAFEPAAFEPVEELPPVADYRPAPYQLPAVPPAAPQPPAVPLDIRVLNRIINSFLKHGQLLYASNTIAFSRKYNNKITGENIQDYKTINFFKYKDKYYGYTMSAEHSYILHNMDKYTYNFLDYICFIRFDSTHNKAIYNIYVNIFMEDTAVYIQVLQLVCANVWFNLAIKNYTNNLYRIEIIGIIKNLEYILFERTLYKLDFNSNDRCFVLSHSRQDYNTIINQAYILEIKILNQKYFLSLQYKTDNKVYEYELQQNVSIVNTPDAKSINNAYSNIFEHALELGRHLIPGLRSGGANNTFEALPIIIKIYLLKEIYEQVFKKNTSTVTTTSVNNDISLRGPLSRSRLGFDNEFGKVFKRHKTSLVYWQRTFNNICKKLLNNSKITSKEMAIFNSIENRVKAVIIKFNDKDRDKRETKRQELLEYIRNKKAELKKNNIEFKDENIINTSKILLNFINVAYIFKLLLVGLTIICIIIYIMVLLISIYNLIVLLMKIIASIIYLFYNTGLTHSDTLSYKVQNIIRCTKTDYSYDVLNVLNEQLTALSVFNTNLYILYIILGYIIIYLLYFIYSTIFAKYYILNGNIKDIDPKFTLITLITIIFTCSFIHLLIYKFLFKSVCYNNYKTCATDEKTADDTIKTYLKSFKDFDDVAENDKFYMLLTDSTKKDEIDIKFQKMVLELEDSILINNNLGKYLLIYNINTYFQEYLYINDKTKELIKDYFDKVIKGEDEDEEPSKSLISFLDLNERRLIKSYHEELPFYNQIPADKVEYFNIINGNVNEVLSSINKSIIKYTGTFYPFLFTCIYIFIICIYNIITTYIILRYISDNKDEQLFPQFIYTMSDKILSIFYRIYNLFI